MGNDEERVLSSTHEVFVEQLQVFAGRTLDDDNQPLEATVILQIKQAAPTDPTALPRGLD